MAFSFTLVCQLVDHAKTPRSRMFVLTVSSSDLVYDLKRAIKTENTHATGHVDAPDLILWKVLTPPPTSNLTVHEQDALNKWFKAVTFHDPDSVEALQGNGVIQLLSDTRDLSYYWKEPPEPEHLHVVVQVPPSPAMSSILATPTRPPKRSTILSDVTSEAGARPGVFDKVLKKTKFDIPTLGELLGFIKQPLADNEKIRITPPIFKELVNTRRPDVCTEEDVRSLFSPSKDVSMMQLDALPFINSASLRPPGAGTETSFIGFWDANIRFILEVLIPYGRSIRNSSQHTIVRNLRPNYGFLVSDKCVFRGEEKGPNSSEDPKAELAEKVVWAYDTAPYVLGYYCSGYNMTPVAIAPPVTPPLPVIHDLVTVDLSLTKSRIENARHLINLACLLRPLTDVLNSANSAIKEFRTMEQNRSTIEITATLVVKKFTCEDATSRVQHLRLIYRTLRERNVPNVDVLVFAQGATVHLWPRGIPSVPRTENELRQCLACVVETLDVIHRIPLYHRDVRWSNIIRSIEDESKWLLIDWEDASYPPTKAEKYFTSGSHSPAIKHDGHGKEVDIWGVGHLISTCRSPLIPPRLQALGIEICEDSEKLNAQDILHLINSTAVW